MRKILLFLALVSVFAACNKKAPDKGLEPVLKQWLFVPDNGDGGDAVYDFTLDGQKCASVNASWLDYPDATYFVWKQLVAPFTGTRENDTYHLTVKESWGGTTDYIFTEVSDDSARLTIKYGGTSAGETVYPGRLSIPKKHIKLVESPLVTIGFQRGVRTHNLGVTEDALNAFKKLAEQKEKWQIVQIKAEGAPGDYDNIDVSGKIVAVNHPNIIEGKADYSVSQKINTAMGKGAVGLVLNIGSDLPIAREQYDDIPANSKIPVAIWQSIGGTMVDSGTYTFEFYD